jgi:ABC-type transport system substrate-binding protein
MQVQRPQVARVVALAVVVAAVGVGAVAVFGDAGGSRERAPSNAAELRGGTLRVGLTDWAAHEERNALPGSRRIFYAFDPQEVRYAPALEIFRCCLLRTLLSYNGRPTEQGGAVLRPDLAAALPAVSADGRTWTFRLKHGLRYAPPLQDTEIVAQDVIRAIERTLSPAPPAWRKHGGAGDCECMYDPNRPGPIGQYAFVYRPLIAGAARFAAGRAQSVSGLEAPDPHTLVVHLVRPSGDVGHAFSLPASAPIPPNPVRQRARMGVAEGHAGGYGQFLVASGPYRLAGSERLDFSRPPDEQRRVAGYVSGRSFTLVRNESWDPATDGLRKAYADRIEFTVMPQRVFLFALTTPPELEALRRAGSKVDDGTLDVLLDTEASEEQLRRPGSTRVVTTKADLQNGLAMNLAQPPFDDVHVRRALNMAIDKRGLLATVTPNVLRDALTEHLAPDSLTGNLLLDWPPPSAGHRGDVVAARAEMARSRYDRDRNGVCDARACKGFRTIGIPGFPDAWHLEVRAMRSIGLVPDLEVFGLEDFFDAATDPRRRVALNTFVFFSKVFPNASVFFKQSFSRASVGTSNVSMVGASPGQLRRFGYDVQSVPSVDAKIAECEPLNGGSQIRCWAQLDQLLMTRIVPWIPFLSVKKVRAISARIAQFSFDQFTSLPALDQIAVRAPPP